MRLLPLVLTAAAGCLAGMWAQDRQVAEWTLFMGGAVGLNGGRGLIHDVAELPTGDFELEVLDWVGMNVDPPDLERLSKLRHLKELHLPGPIWNRNADGDKDLSVDLRSIAPITTLEKLTFSYHFLDRIRFHDPGLDEIRGLVNLKELVLRQAGVKGRSLGPFHKLEALDVTLCPLGDEGLSSVKGMPGLRRLWAGDTLITDAGLPHLSALRDLEDLDLHGTQISDRGLVHLNALMRLRKLNLMGTGVTDAGLEQLGSLVNLEELNLYRTRITNAGLDRLKRLKALRQVDLRYTRTTAAGVEALHAALPSASLLSLETTARAGSQAHQKHPAGKSDAAVAHWVRSLGGSAVMEGSRLVELSLAATGVSDEQLKDLSGLRHLRKLNLEATEISDLGVRHLARLSELTELSLNSTTVSDAGLARLAGMRKLRRLSLDNTYIEGLGVVHLQTLKELADLSLRGSPVKDAGVAELSRIPSIRRLSLAYSDITSQGMAHLESLPALTELDRKSTRLNSSHRL